MASAKSMSNDLTSTGLSVNGASENDDRNENEEVHFRLKKDESAREGPPVSSHHVEDTGGSPVTLHNRAQPSHSHRKLLLYTSFSMAAYFALGLMPSQTGVSFLDLIHNVQTDIEHGSLIFTMSNVGYILGSMVGGFLFDKFNNDVIFGACAVMSGLLTIGVPWCPVLGMMVATVAARSLFTGAMDSGGTIILLKLWGNKANPYMQALHFMFALGGIFSPLITEPFLMVTLEENSTEVANTTVEVTPSSTDRWSTPTHIQSTPELPVANQTTFALEARSSQLFIPHIIVGVFTIFTAIPFLVKYIKFQEKEMSRCDKDGVDHEKQAPNRSLRVNILYLFLFCVYFFGYGCTEEVYGAFLMPFVVKYLGWNKSDGARSNSVYWGSFASGRFLGIFIAKVLSVTNMVLVDFIAIIAGLFGFLFAAGKSAIAIWLCNALVGFSMASVFASSVTWLDQNVTKVTGKIAGLFVVAMSCGTVTNTALLGYLFEEISGMWFIYLTLGNTMVSLLLFITLYFMRGRSEKTVETNKNVMELAIKENT